MSDVEVAQQRLEPPGCEVVVQAAGAAAQGTLAALEEWTRDLLGELSPRSTSLTVRLVDEDGMRCLNREYRGIDRATDVLSFPGEESPRDRHLEDRHLEERHLGDIAIALPVAERQARDAGHPLATELEVLVLHGVLHCLGHDHETDGGEMEALEAELRSRRIPRCSPRR